MTAKLHKTMSLRDFDNGYWYQTELVAFAKRIGVLGATKLRKNEIQPVIRAFLQTGRLPPIKITKSAKKGPKDIDTGLSLKLAITHYTSNKITKDFIRAAAQRKAPGIKQKSGVWYRLNRWREAQVAKRTVTYGELVDQFVALNRVEKFERIPYDCYINFLADFLKRESGATHQEARTAWKQLKRMDAPKSYKAWKAAGKQ